MVSTNDILLLGGGLLAAIYLSKRSDQIATIAPNDYYQQVQAVDIQRLSEFGSRIEQLKDIRSQILGYEKGQAEAQISYLESQISEAQQAGSEYQRALTSGRFFGLSRTAAARVQQFGGDLIQAYQSLISQGGKYSLQAGTILESLKRQQAQAGLTATQEFITQAEAQQADIMAKYSELEQIV